MSPMIGPAPYPADCTVGALDTELADSIFAHYR